MAVGERNDPLGQFNFMLEIDGITIAGFTEVSGITAESEVIEYREGTDPAKRKLPGIRMYGNVTLKRGCTVTDELFRWRKSTEDGQTERKSCAVILLDEARTPALRWLLSETWVAKYEGPAFNSTTSEAAIEALELACERVEMEVA